MNGELIWVLSLLAVAVVLFATGKVRMDAIALLVIVAFVLSDTLTLSEAFSGFSDPNVILIAALFIIGDGLVRTGVATKMGSWLVKVAGNSETKMLVYLMLTVAGIRGVYELDRRGGHFYPRGAQRVDAHEHLPFAVDDAAQFCRTYQRDDDPGGHTAQPGR
ncbi:transport protein [Klebsiella michiganensis]|uniref:Transport protein n=1 Tax=Klebsiella michiganensis TaxID=1134687 RepID=A0A7H4PP65_9ENTR|nr:transport protein [Klebsiella michiganensis]